MLVATTVNGVTTYAEDGATGVVTTTMNALKQAISMNPLNSGETIALSSVVGIAAYYFGHKKGYDDRAAGKAYKMLGVL